MANNARVSFELDEKALRAVILQHKGVLAAITERANGKQADLEVVGTNFYQAAVDATQDLLNQGIPGNDKARYQLRVSNPYLPGGKRMQVGVDWKPLSLDWRENKRERALGSYSGKLRSLGPRVFWLDTGTLRSAFAQWAPGKARMNKSKPIVRLLSNGDFQVDHPLAFKKLSPAFLDQALRRALIAGAAAGRRGAVLEPLGRTNKRGGIYRAVSNEVRRPLMRPLAIRLGKAMQEQMTKLLRRR
jgi:hypothetical protein